jgi:hypothetical protein
MTKQLLKGLSAAGVAAMFMVASAPADAADIRCRVPFSFEVNGNTLPPGTYHLNTDGNIMWVRSAARTTAVLTLGRESRTATDPKLVFHKYGDEYVLREAWTGGGSGRVLPAPRRNREAARQAPSGKTALGFERVVIPGL